MFISYLVDFGFYLLFCDHSFTPILISYFFRLI